MGEVWFLGNV